MRQCHQGKEGFMKVTRIQDKYNPDKGSHKGTEEDNEGSWIGAGELACGQEPSGLIGSSEPGISEEGWRKTKDKDYIKEPVIGWKGRL